MKELSCFKAYDIRGKLGEELNESIAERVGRAYAQYLSPKKVVVGHDVRKSSKSLTDALAEGLIAQGTNVVNIGLCGTEEIYFATFSQEFDGGIMVTASHNPIDYNGMKLVKNLSRPISGDNGLNEIRFLAEKNNFTSATVRGNISEQSFKNDYIEHLLSYIELEKLGKLKIVVDPGNGCAGPIIDLLEKHLPFEFIKLHYEPANFNLKLYQPPHNQNPADSTPF